jgi:nucleotide-binding universal stress UspA family protein
MNRMSNRALWAGAAVAAVALGCVSVTRGDGSGADRAETADPALERARDTTRMLDTLYKTAVVSITENYVSARANTPAAETVKPVFAAMAKNGWHTVRLIDGTGEPLNKANVAADEFEKSAVAKIMAGAPSVEQVETEGDRRFLRTATVVPVVMRQCQTCHAGLKLNAPMGALVYRVPVK